MNSCHSVRFSHATENVFVTDFVFYCSYKLRKTMIIFVAREAALLNVRACKSIRILYVMQTVLTTYYTYVIKS